MKAFAWIALASLACVGCSSEATPEDREAAGAKASAEAADRAEEEVAAADALHVADAGGSYWTTRVGACNYVVWKLYNAGGITHAGDCPNPIHRADTLP